MDALTCCFFFIQPSFQVTWGLWIMCYLCGGTMVIPMCRLWIHGLYGLHGLLFMGKNDCLSAKLHKDLWMDFMNFLRRGGPRYKELLKFGGCSRSQSGPLLNIKNIRRSWDHLIYNIGITILVRRHLYIEMAWSQDYLHFFIGIGKIVSHSTN